MGAGTGRGLAARPVLFLVYVFILEPVEVGVAADPQHPFALAKPIDVSDSNGSAATLLERVDAETEQGDLVDRLREVFQVVRHRVNLLNGPNPLDPRPTPASRLGPSEARPLVRPAHEPVAVGEVISIRNGVIHFLLQAGCDTALFGVKLGQALADREECVGDLLREGRAHREPRVLAVTLPANGVLGRFSHLRDEVRESKDVVAQRSVRLVLAKLSHPLALNVIPPAQADIGYSPIL